MTDQRDLFQALVGEWVGKSTLILNPADPGDTQPTSAEVSQAANGHALLVNYVWHVDNAPERGTILVERDPKQPGFRAAWIDSWHSQRAMMILTGQTADQIDMYGKYQAEGWPEWGWRIRLKGDGDQMRLLMWNITPEGQEVPAVIGEYQRVRESGG